MSAPDSPNRLSLALPIDVIRRIDVTVSDAQIADDQPLSTAGDYDAFAAAIEDAEGEFKRMVGLSSRVSREGIPGRRETYEEQTYAISGHKLTKGTFTGVWTDYLPEEQHLVLANDRLLPFDSEEGDEVYFYQGLNTDGDTWVNLTDEEGDIWQFIDHRRGKFVFDPYQLTEFILDDLTGTYRTLPTFLKEMRFAISYRHGILDRSSSQVGQTELGASLTDSETGLVSVGDVEVLSRGRVSSTAILRIGSEYVTAEYDRAAGDIDIIERGVRGTDAVAHDSGETVMYVPPEYRKAVAARAGMDIATSQRYRAWLPDADDSMDREAVIGELESVWMGIVDALGSGD
jgi:hypothetical protein